MLWSDDAEIYVTQLLDLHARPFSCFRMTQSKSKPKSKGETVRSLENCCSQTLFKNYFIFVQSDSIKVCGSDVTTWGLGESRRCQIKK